MLRVALPLLALGLVLLAGPAAAHTTVATPDGKYLVTAGNLNEPITTHTKTGLDLIIRSNQTPPVGITGAHLTLTATLIAPNGEERSQTLVGQFGKPGSYSFEDPYYLTVAGEYYLRVTGTINDTDVHFDRILVGSGAVPAIEDLGFPDDLQSDKQLQARITALEAKIAAIEAQEQGARGNSPGFDPLASLVLLAAVGLFVARARRRA